jgi:hypothetical protein
VADSFLSANAAKLSQAWAMASNEDLFCGFFAIAASSKHSTA